MNIQKCNVRIVFILSIPLLFLGCGGPILIPPSDYETTRLPSSTTIPLSVEFYTPTEFKNRIFIGNKGGMEMAISIGDVMLLGAEKSLRNIFREVVIGDNPDPTGKIKHINIIIIPEIIAAENRLTGNPPFSKWDSSVTCKWTIKTTDGKILYMNTIVGKSNYEALTTAFTYRDRVGKSMLLAVQDHYGKLTEDLLSVKWW